MARKYEKGEQIRNIQEFSEQTLIWWHGKVYHKGWLFSWQLHLILRLMGTFYKVVPIRKEEKKDGDNVQEMRG